MTDNSNKEISGNEHEHDEEYEEENEEKEDEEESGKNNNIPAKYIGIGILEYLWKNNNDSEKYIISGLDIASRPGLNINNMENRTNLISTFMSKKDFLLFDKNGEYIDNFSPLELFKYLTENILAKNILLDNFKIRNKDGKHFFPAGKYYIYLMKNIPLIIQKLKEPYFMGINNIYEFNNNLNNRFIFPGLSNFNLNNANINYNPNIPNLPNLYNSNINNLNNNFNTINFGNNGYNMINSNNNNFGRFNVGFDINNNNNIFNNNNNYINNNFGNINNKNNNFNINNNNNFTHNNNESININNNNNMIKSNKNLKLDNLNLSYDDDKEDSKINNHNIDNSNKNNNNIFYNNNNNNNNNSNDNNNNNNNPNDQNNNYR